MVRKPKLEQININRLGRLNAENYSGTIRDDGSSVLSALIYDGIFAELTDDERDMLVNYPSKLEA